MANYSEREESIARRFLNSLFSNQNDRQLEFSDLNAPVADIEDDARQLRAESDLLTILGIGFPAILLGGETQPIPVSIFHALGGRMPYMLRSDYRYWYESSDYLLRNYKHTLSPAQAVDAFKRQATSFLATRLHYINQVENEIVLDEEHPSLYMLRNLGGNYMTTPGCHFKVTSNSSGLRVHWSGAYYISSKYFAAPTSPVRGILQAGTYVFGVDGGAYGSTIQWDKKARVSLPGSPNVHLNY